MNKKSALIVVDMQNDFMQGGALAVQGALELVPLIVQKIKTFSHTIATLDWHPPNHCSFADSHPGKKVGDQVMIRGKPQRLWPIHCVQNTAGAKLTSGLSASLFEAIFYKGTDPLIDSYSAFYDNAHEKSTRLSEYLRKHQIDLIALAGVALDYCVLYSALDARKEGFDVTVFSSLCKAIDNSSSGEKKVFDLLRQHGVKIIRPLA